MVPKSDEYFVGTLSVLELFVELVGPAGIGYSAIEPNESEGEVIDNYFTHQQLLTHQIGLLIVQQHVDHFNIASRNIGVGDDILLTQKETAQFQYLSNMLTPDHFQVILFEGEHGVVELTDQRQQQLG